MSHLKMYKGVDNMLVKNSAKRKWIILSINIPITFVSETVGIGYTLVTSLFIYGAIMVSLRKYYVHAYGKIDALSLVPARSG